MRLWQARHGESTANIEGVHAGQRIDAELSDKGMEQAKTLSKKAEDLPIERIVSSPLKRAKQTADVIGKKLGINVEIDDRLTEYDMGEASGKSIYEVIPEFKTGNKLSEDPKKFKSRVINTLQDLSDSDKNTLIIIHGAVSRMIEVIRTSYDPAKLYKLECPPNAEITEINLKEVLSRE